VAETIHARRIDMAGTVLSSSFLTPRQASAFGNTGQCVGRESCALSASALVLSSIVLSKTRFAARALVWTWIVAAGCRPGAPAADASSGDAAIVEGSGVCDSTDWCWETEPQPFTGCSNAVLRERDDYWALCPGAVVRRSGGRITRYLVPRVSPVGALVEHGAGELWTSTVGGDVYRFDGTRFIAVPDTAYGRVVRSSGGRALWIVTNGREYRRWNGAGLDPAVVVDGVICVNDEGEFFASEGASIARVRAGVRSTFLSGLTEPANAACLGRSLVLSSYANTSMRVVSMDDARETSVTLPAGVREIVRGHRGALYVIDGTNGVHRVAADGALALALSVPADWERGFHFDIDPDSGDAFAIRNTFAYRYDGAAWTPMATPRPGRVERFVGAAGQPPAALLGDQEWARRESDGGWTFERYPAAVSVSDVAEVFRGIDASAQFLTLSDGRVVRWQGGVAVFSLPEAARGAVLFARSSSDAWSVRAEAFRIAIRRWDGGSWRDADAVFPGSDVMSLASDDDGALLVLSGTNSPPGGPTPELRRVSNTTVTRVPIPNAGPTSGQQSALVRDASQTLWLLLSRQLHFRSAGSTMVQALGDPTEPLQALSIAPSGRGVVLVGAGGEDVREVDSRTRVPRPIAPSAVCSGPTWATAGHLWIGGSNGRVVRHAIAP
jgi:hypothetical protein